MTSHVGGIFQALYYGEEKYSVPSFIVYKKKKWENKKLIHQNLNSKNHIHIEQICISNEDKSKSNDGHSDRLCYLFLDNCTLNPVSGMMGSGGQERDLTAPLTLMEAPDYVNPEMILFSNIKY